MKKKPIDFEQKYKEIFEYYKFHKNIESYFLEGYNINYNGNNEYFYFIDSNWIKDWKLHVNYDNAIQYIEKDYNFLMKNNNLKIKINNDYTPSNINSGNSKQEFLNKKLYNIEDFDNMINQSTYDLFRNYKSYLNYYISTDQYIEGVLYDKMLILLIKEQKKIKIFYKGEMENKKELIQLTLEFPNDNYFSNMKINYIFNIKDSYDNFIENYIIKNNCNKLMEFLEKLNMGYSTEKNIKNDNNNKCHIINNNLYEKYNKEKKIIPENITNNIDSPRFIGLENIGATCYMNATLQCLVNVDDLTRYLLTNNNYIDIINNEDKCEILSIYCNLLEKLCCDLTIEKYYNPKDFKEIISRKNPLFKGIQANDSKDLIYYLLEQFNYELNIIKKKIKNNIIYTESTNDIINNIFSQSNRILMLTNFIKEYSYLNNNIMPKLFFSLIENETVCKGCNNHKYNYQTVFSLEFPLEKYYNNIYGIQNNNINKKLLSLYECFSNYNESNFFQGENSIYCNICKIQQNAIYKSRIYSLSPILIIILNRGKGNIFDCDVNFPENINVKQYIESNKSNYNYRLIGVVSHLGSSDMSGHFIAYCRHRITKEWYFFNDSIVIRCNDQYNDYKKGVPYILFYESTQEKYNVLFDDEYLNFNSSMNPLFNNNNLSNQNNSSNNINNNYQNNNINSINNNQILLNNNMNVLNNMNFMNMNMNNLYNNNNFMNYNSFSNNI